MGLPTVSFNSKSHEKYLIDSAVLLANLKWNSTAEEWEFTELGATEGSVSITVEMSYRQMEVNGTSHLQVKQQQILETFNASATATIKEQSAAFITRAINGELVDIDANEAPSEYKKIVPKRFVNDESFLDNIAFVGKLSSNGGQPIIVVLDNAKPISGFNGSTEDNGEMAVEQEYVAHADINDLKENADYLPLRFYVPGSIIDGQPQELEVGA